MFKIYSNPITESVEILPKVLYYVIIGFDLIIILKVLMVITMFIEERHYEISESIKENGKITITEITEKYHISDESARRDLRLLEQRGMCKRTRGGAISVRQIGLKPPADRDFQTMPIYENYMEIARSAVAKIRENDIIYLTSGSFGHIAVSFLPKDIRYTVVVNSVDMGKELRTFDNIGVYVTGGKMRQSGSLVDSLAVDFISKMHFDCCFLTGSGLTADFGLSNGTDETATFQRSVIKNSRKKYLLIPGIKVGENAFIKVCNADEFDEIFTDWECIEEQIIALEEKGIKVTVAEESK